MLDTRVHLTRKEKRLLQTEPIIIPTSLTVDTPPIAVELSQEDNPSVSADSPVVESAQSDSDSTATAVESSADAPADDVPADDIAEPAGDESSAVDAETQRVPVTTGGLPTISVAPMARQVVDAYSKGKGLPALVSGINPEDEGLSKTEILKRYEAEQARIQAEDERREAALQEIQRQQKKVLEAEQAKKDKEERANMKALRNRKILGRTAAIALPISGLALGAMKVLGL